jgi:tripartite-type tricarboxylate transporter receptor subunit TctC
VLALACASSYAHAQDPFYKGRTIKLIIGANTGGSYDTYGRLLAAHLAKKLPGNPTIVPENMSGASGIRAAAYLDQVAPKDGTMIAMFNQSIAQRQVLEPEQVKFDMRKFAWIGAMASSVTVSFTWHESGVKSLDDARKKDVIMGALGADGGNAVFPLLFNKYLGTRFKVVTGYPGGNTIQLAMERREVDGQGSFPWSGLKAGWAHWIADKKVNILIQLGLAKDPELPDVPLLLDLAKSPAEKALFHFISADTAIGAPVAAPPGIPADRVETLRRSFDVTMADNEFLADAAARKSPISATRGDDVQKIVASLIEASPEVIAMFKTSVADARSQSTEKK